MSAPVASAAAVTVADRVRVALRLQFGALVDPVGADDLLSDALGDRYDSLAALECVCRIESTFGIEVDFVEHDIRHHFSTLRLIAEFVAERLEDLAVLGGATDS
ncbi:acyl carrier protein [Kutzneria sp. CA-103260]|uniref:acyl carrier protein n=1 Tax=Kutzneria sp. CA-103260 TaxID=2802641 RepID=UPI001BADF813|nr:acyl carrier protein [Kutzneria sp. CA-103260]QUQ68823.1 hypothetical protein JJ691_65700 [Kutzneria sp. CA-103260]